MLLRARPRPQVPLFRPPKPYTLVPGLSMFNAHPNLADDVNRGIIQSEIEGGVFLNDLPPLPFSRSEPSSLLHRRPAGRSEALLSGHPEFWPASRAGRDRRINLGRFMLKLQYVGRACTSNSPSRVPTPIITRHPGNPRLPIRRNSSLRDSDLNVS